MLFTETIDSFCKILISLLMRNGVPFLLEVPLSKEENLLKRFEEIHDYIYSHDGLSPQQTLEEFVKMLFVKIIDEQSGGGVFVISETEQEQLNTGQPSNDLSERVGSLFTATKNLYGEVFETDDRIRLSPNALGFIVEKLQSISLSDSANDAKGLAFQKFLSRHEKGDRGQYFTPEPVVDFCVKMIQPRKEETIIDPACGSGGFLLSALKYLHETYPNENLNTIVEKQLFGLDISQSVARIAKMKLLLESGGKPNVLCGNTLDTLESVQYQLGCFDGFDIVLTNPPFGAKISDDSLLSRFDLGRKWTYDKMNYYRTQSLHNSQTAEILFIERSLQLLKPGGRMAIVLPNGNFDNPSLGYLRAYIKSQANILAVIRLPQETFIPYGTGVKTSLLFLRKKLQEQNDPKTVFFATISKLGYHGNKNGTPMYKKDKCGNLVEGKDGQVVLDEDFSTVCQDFLDYQNGDTVDSDSSFVIDYSLLNERLDYDYYSPKHRQFFDGLDETNSVRLGDICTIVKEKSAILKNQEALVEYIELSDINFHSFEIVNSTSFAVHELPSRASYEIRTGDILTAIAGNSVGTRKHATAFVSQEYDGCLCTNGFRVLRNFTVDPYYVLFFLRSEVFLKQMYMLRTGAAIPNVSDIDLENIRVYLPTKKKIKEISKVVKKSFDMRVLSHQIIDQVSLVG